MIVCSFINESEEEMSEERKVGTVMDYSKFDQGSAIQNGSSSFSNFMIAFFILCFICGLGFGIYIFSDIKNYFQEKSSYKEAKITNEFVHLPIRDGINIDIKSEGDYMEYSSVLKKIVSMNLR